MLARVAENIYWLARYLERAENTARLISVNANLLLDLQRGYELGGCRSLKSPAAGSHLIRRSGAAMSARSYSFCSRSLRIPDPSAPH